MIGPAGAAVDDVRRALALPNFDGAAAQRHMAPINRPMARPDGAQALSPNGPRLSAVLLLLYDVDDELYLVLIRRPDYDGVHGGQVACPGGRHEPPESLGETALRETCEEIGIRPAEVELLGTLTPLYVLPSDFEVHPFAGRYTGSGRPRFVPDPREVAAILEVPLRVLLDPATRAEEMMEVRDGLRMKVPFFRLDDHRAGHLVPHKVWGATAMILGELVERLRAAGS